MGGAWAQTAIPPSEGDGSEGSPYIITKAEELAWFRDQVNSGNIFICAKISDDVEVIDMSTVCHAADASKNLVELSWEPIGNDTYMYRGTFDGNGKTITNLYIKTVYIKTENQQAGLFGYTFQSTIKNLTFENANVTNTELYTGILVGAAGYQTTLQNIKISTNKCQVIGGKDYTGGIAGSLDGNAYNCVNYAMVQGQEDVGGLFGYYSREGNSITACANYGKVTAARKNAGGLVGYFDSGTIQDCANYGDITGTNAVGNLIGSADKCNLNNVLGTGNVTATSSPSFSKRGGLLAGYINDSSSTASGILAYNSCAKLTINGTEQTGDAVKTIGEGSLTSAEKIKAFTTEQLKSGLIANLLQKNASESAKWGQNLANNGDIYPVIGSEHTVYSDNSLVNCMTYEIISGSFTNNTTSSAIKYQHGQTINHHVATNATCTEAATKEYWQCQDCLRTYSDSQLTEELTDVTIAEKPALGHKNDEDGYCNQCQHYVAVKPSQESGVYLISKPCHLAWFRDYVNGTIVDDGEAAGTTHPSASAKLTADIDLKNYCHAAEDGKELLSWLPIGNDNNRWKGNMDGQAHTISNLYIKTAQNYVGLFGYTDGATIQDLIFDNAKVENVSTTGTNTSYYTGILAGRAYGDSPLHIRGIKTTNNCTVIGQKDTGGIVGGANINLENCENHSSVKGTSNVGGIAGFSQERNIKRCTNYGTVENNGRNQYIGGIIGYAYGISIEDCANYGNITSAGPVAGGIAGSTMDNSSIQNVFSYGDVTYTNTSGIIIGHVGGTLTAKGIVAYNKEALLNNSSENIKIVGAGSLTLEDGKVEADVVKAFTKQQIKSGEVAWLLNGSTSTPAEGSTLAWYQTLGENGDEYPVLTPKDGNTVYYIYCTCVDKQLYIYSNTENEKYDKHDKGTETLLTNGLYSSTCQRCQANFKYIKDFCGIKGNDLELTDDNGKYIAKAVTLKDGEAYNSPVDIEVKDLKYARTYAANKWQPLYVPFAMNVEQWTGKGLTVASINNFHEMKLKAGDTQVLLEVKKVTSGSLEPNVPYLILCDAEGEKLLELGATTLSKAEEGSIDCHSVTRNYVFQGKYSTMSGLGASETAIYYGVKDGEMVQLTAEDVIGPQNWYLTVTNRPNLYDVDTPLTSAAKAFSIRVIGDGEATGIEDIHVISDEGENGKQGIFDLQGRKLDAEPTHGIYIKNGKKYVK